MTEEDPLSTTLSGFNGITLYCRSWEPEDTPVATIALVHGLGEHSGRYRHVARYFTERGYAVCAIDLRGHGKSDGLRGHVDSFTDYLKDVKTLISFARRENRAAPLFLMGHSMGGLIALTYALKYSDGLTSVIASGPGLRGRVSVPAWKSLAAKVMSSLYPRLSMANGLDPAGISHDSAVVQAYIADPLVHNQVTARWYTEFVNTGAWAIEEANSLSVPALILQGGDDPIVDPAGTREFFERIGLDDKRYIEYPGLYHEILNEPQHPDVLNDIESWLAPHLPSSLES